MNEIQHPSDITGCNSRLVCLAHSFLFIYLFIFRHLCDVMHQDISQLRVCVQTLIVSLQNAENSSVI